MYNYPHPTISREGRPFLAHALYLFSAVDSKIKSFFSWSKSDVDVYLYKDASPLEKVSDKVSATEMILAEF